MKSVFKWLLDRVKEGSTWAGVGIIAAALGISNEVAMASWELLAAAAGLGAILLKDKAPAEDPKG